MKLNDFVALLKHLLTTVSKVISFQLKHKIKLFEKVIGINELKFMWVYFYYKFYKKKVLKTYEIKCCWKRNILLKFEVLVLNESIFIFACILMTPAIFVK